MDMTKVTKTNIKKRQELARSAFSFLNNVWKATQYSTKTKLRIFDANVSLTMVNHRESWEEAWCIPSEMSSENFEDTLATQDIKSATKWKYNNDQAFANNQKKTFEMGNPCSPNRQQFELNIRTELRPLGFPMERECEEDQGYQLEMHTGESEKKNLGGGVTVRERCRLLQASVVSGVFCYTVSCVLRDRKG